jgi:hypothetical protein
MDEVAPGHWRSVLLLALASLLLTGSLRTPTLERRRPGCGSSRSLVECDRCVQELQAMLALDMLALDQASVSQYHSVLRANQVVTARKEGATARDARRDCLVGDLLGVAPRTVSNQHVGTQDMLRAPQREHRRR